MADPDGSTLNSDEISDLLHTFLQSSAFPSPPISQLQQHRQPAAEISGSIGLIDSFSSLVASSLERIGDFDSDCERDRAGSEGGKIPAPSRSSLKRTRAAEFHNLTEKKRRQKISENLKALQKFIPNSNKTDKASMLDDAINYLRHLQLQVQMLAIRNGSSLHPYYMAGMNSTLQTPARIDYNMEDEVSCISRGVGSAYGNQEFSTTIYDADQYAFLDGKTLMPSAHSFYLDPSCSAHYCRP